MLLSAMAAAQSLLLQQRTIYKVENRSCHHHPSLQLPSNTFSSVVNFKYRTKSFKNLSVRSFSLNNNTNNSVDDNRRSNNGDSNQDFCKFGFPKFEFKRNPFKIAAETLINSLKPLQKPATKAVVILGLLLLMCAPNKYALAASGGRVGGCSSSYTLRRSSSSRKSRRGYSRTDRYRSSYSSYSSSSLSSTVSSSSPVIVENSEKAGLSSMRRRCGRRLQKSPFGWYHFAPAVATVPSSSAVTTVPSSSAVSPSSRFGSGEYYGDRRDYSPVIFVLLLFAFGLACETWYNISKDRMSVLKLQVGLLGSGSLQKDLNRIAETADTSTARGSHYLLTDTVLALLRYPDYCISAFSSIDMNWSMEGAEERFYQLSLEERGKFDDIRKRSSTTVRSSQVSNEHMVVTILVAARRKLELPSINNSKDLKEVLEKLGSLPLSRTVEVEVLWTTRKEDATISKHKLLESYPLWRPI